MTQKAITLRFAAFRWKPLVLSIPNGSLLIWLGLAISLKDYA